MSISQGFLEQLYRGTNDQRLFGQPNTIDDAKISDFMDQYREIISQYKALDIEKIGTAPKDLLDKLRNLGIFGLTVPKEYGGLGFSLSEYLRVVEEMARYDMALVLIPLAHLSIGMKGILLFGNEEQKHNYLPKAASGEMIFGYALTEPKIGSDAQNITTVAKKDGDFYILNGGKTYITNANYAGGFTVFAQLDEKNPGNIGAFIVERSWDGVQIGQDMPKMGLKVSSTAAVLLKNVKVPKENLLGSDGDGFKIAMNILNYGRLGLGAASSGLMLQSFEDMRKRSTSRIQFKTEIENFQLVQEKMVDALALQLAVKNMTYFTARLLEKDPLMNVAIESSHTKLFGTNQCWNTLYEALQTAGGSGFIQTQPYEKRMRDFRVTTIFEGTTEIHSIYPPLTIIRDMGKVLKTKSNLGKLFYLHSFSSKKALNTRNFSSKIQNFAWKKAQRLEQTFRKLMADSLKRFSKNIVTEEYILRRLTNMSVYLFALISSTLDIEERKASLSKESLDLELQKLAYLTQRANLALRMGKIKGRSALEQKKNNLFRSVKQWEASQFKS